MKKLTMLAAIAGIAGGLALGATAPAMAAGTFNFSFNTGDVAFAYNDGYWDHNHNWHAWHNAREAREYRARFGGNYHAWRHTRDKNQGWMDNDHDGVPNRADNRPNNPFRN